MNLTLSHRIFVAVLVQLAAFMLPGHAQAQPSNEAIWQQFVQWLPSAPPFDNPDPLFSQYRSRLIAAGASAAEADRQMVIIRRTMQERPNGWRIIFNNIYSTSTPGFSTQPNALLISTVEGRKPGRALDVGMGQGRNSVFLALKGWDVTGFDISDEGLAVAGKNAERAGVKLNAIRETDEAFDYGSDQCDMIVRTVSCDLGSLCRASTQVHEVWWVDRDRELWRRCYDAQSTADGHRSRTVACGVQGFSSAALRGHYGRARLGTAEEACCPHGRRKAAVRSV